MVTGITSKNKLTLIRVFFFFKFLKELHCWGCSILITVALNGNCPRWAVAFLQKCCYKWWPRECLGLNAAYFILFYFSKNGENISKSHKFFGVFFHFLKTKFSPSCEISPQHPKRPTPKKKKKHWLYCYPIQRNRVKTDLANDMALGLKVG